MTDECLLAPKTAGLPSPVPLGLPTPYQRDVLASRRTVGVHWLGCSTQVFGSTFADRSERKSRNLSASASRGAPPPLCACARARAREAERSIVPLRRLRAARTSSGSFTPVTSAEGLHSRPASPWHQSKASCREANTYLFNYFFLFLDF